MITIDEALRLVLEQVPSRPPETIHVSHARGRVLAAPIQSSVDSPPHHKAMMDGYAVVAADLTVPARELEVIGTVTAGDLPTRSVTTGTAIRIMTGAPIPAGADAVVMVEQAEPGEGPRVVLRAPAVEAGQNILAQGSVFRRGDTLLRAGHTLRAIELGLLAELGTTEVKVAPQPTVAILATGNELVPPGKRLDPGHIYNSNGPLLMASAEQVGAESLDLGIARDDARDLAERIERGLDADVLVLSGGVSMGTKDLVPAALAEAGVAEVFHKVRLRPGKPLWFGVCDRRVDGRTRRTLVFGCPGNPVSTFVTFHKFVRPALASLTGCTNDRANVETGRLTHAFATRGERAILYPARWSSDADGQIRVTLLDWRGSADIFTLTQANCLSVFPPGARQYAEGEAVQYERI